MQTLASNNYKFVGSLSQVSLSVALPSSVYRSQRLSTHLADHSLSRCIYQRFDILTPGGLSQSGAPFATYPFSIPHHYIPAIMVPFCAISRILSLLPLISLVAALPAPQEAAVVSAPTTTTSVPQSASIPKIFRRQGTACTGNGYQCVKLSGGVAVQSVVCAASSQPTRSTASPMNNTADFSLVARSSCSVSMGN